MPRNIDPSFVDTMTPNFAQLFLDRVAKSSSLEAYRFPTGDSWESVTWKQAGDRVSNLAAGLLSLGIQPEQRVGIASSTRYEWILADLAVMCAGGATTTVYPSTNDEDTAYIVSDSECRVVFAEDDVQIKKLADRKAELPTVAKVITFDGTADGDWVISLDALADLGEKYLVEHPDAIAKTVAAIKPEQLATLIYTSGTTGRPKGVRLHAPLLGLRGRRDRRRRTSSTRRTCSSCGCRWRTRSARCCSRPSSPAASRPRSTAGSTRSSTTWAW